MSQNQHDHETPSGSSLHNDDASSEQLPAYTEHKPTESSQTSTTKGDSKDHHASQARASLTPAQRASMLDDFKRDREVANDNFGGHKGSAGQWAPNDPTRAFRRLSQIVRRGEQKGEDKVEWRKERAPDEGDRGWNGQGYGHEISKGDFDERLIV